MQFIDQMLDVKKGRTRAMYEHPLLEKVCGDTFGVMIYQEQVQNAAKVLAGYSLGGADLLRRAMGKKDPVEMEKQRAKFVEGAEATNNIGKKLADQIFDKIAMFAGYGFNKSHSACYGHISYWTAYLKANHPVEFMAALLSNEIHNTDKIGVFVSECHRMGLEILPPDLNASQLRFSPEVTPNGAKGVRYGLAAIKNCGEGAMAIAIADREKNGKFTSLDDFASRLDSKVVNKRILENLAKAGALDWTEETRAGMCARLEQVVASASSAQKDRASGQVSMFDSMDFSAPAPKTKSQRTEASVPEWSKDERLAHEKELLGFYVTGHPLDKFRSVIDSSKYRKLGLIDDIDLSNARERFPFAGMVRSLDAKTTKTGKPFGVLVLEDFTGSAEIMLWGETFVPARDAGLLEPGKIIKLKGNIQVDDRTGGRRITGNELGELKQKRVAANGKGPLELMLSTTRHSDRDLIEIKLALTDHPGPTPVLLHFQNSAGRRITVAAGESFNVKRSEDLEEALGRWLED
jgi:DNA polymerase-3 subunit alpha